jgi:methylenetetrahydrofolate dehydrogenase (NADP+)/methenyltetrahydrofolate cyclohydrolase
VELIDGKALSLQIKKEVRAKVDSLPGGKQPCLTLVQVGDDPASSVYVRNKIRSCEECGIKSEYMHLDAGIPEGELLHVLRELSRNDSVHGILLQLPLPGHLDEDKVVSTIDPVKDVDGFHPENIGLLASGKPRFIPCTPAGIIEMLRRYGIDTRGKDAVVLGRSLIVGKPMAMLLSQKSDAGDATVTICHSRTRDLKAHTSSADILVVAMGKAGFVRGDMVKEGAVVIDVGINRVEDESRKKGYRLVGDVDFEEVAPKTSYITPVPGGVGPMTVAMLMVNTLKAYGIQEEASDGGH